MAGKLSAIWIAAQALSFGVVGTFITWKSSEMDNKFFSLKKNKQSISLIAYVFAKVFMFIVHCICSALSCRLSAQFCLQLPHGCSAFCCLNMSLTHIPLLKPKTLPSVCADLVNPGIIKKISRDVFFDLREIACYSCYHAQGQRLFCTSDCWHCQNKADM